MQRIFLLPNTQHHPVTLSSADSAADLEMVYAPVPRSSLPKELQDRATEAWVSTSNSRVEGSGHHHHHHRRHHHHRTHSHGHGRRHRSSSRETTGLIKLDIEPDEGLLPSYDVKA